MDVIKAASTGTGGPVSEADLEAINRLSRKKLTAEEVYTFAVRLCDNEVDRDYERFPAETLGELAELFVGKSGVFDHQWSARGQNARIYRTELAREEAVRTEAGDGYCYLKGWAYMLRTEGNADLIAEIEGGIKKEVSVGCAVGRSVCSVCGADIAECGHEKGKRYGGRLCYAELRDAADAYEWSFVAVPAQRRAGVVKSMKREEMRLELKEFLRERPEYVRQVEALKADAALGRRYLDGLRGEVKRMGGLAEPGMDPETLGRIAEKLSEAELLEMKKVYAARLERYPTAPQLPHRGAPKNEPSQDGAFLI